MGLRPTAAHWFEALTRREDTAQAAEALAATGAVEIELHGPVSEVNDTRDLGHLLDTFGRLEKRYQPYWPKPSRSSGGGGLPAEVLHKALANIENWARASDPIIQHIECVQSERSELSLFRIMVGEAQGDLPDLHLLSHAGPTLVAAAYACVGPCAWPEHFADIETYRVDSSVPGSKTPIGFLIAVGPRSAMAEYEPLLAALKARRIEIPKWVSQSDPASQLQSRVDELDQELARLHQRLDEQNRTHDLARALSDVERVRWFIESVPYLPHTRNFARISGWTSESTPEPLQHALDRCTTAGVVDLCPAPDREPPVLLQNPRWARPFELLTRLLGTPGRDEVDPSSFVSIIAPAIFGYMFGDVGQGLVLLVSGFLLRRKIAALGLLIPAGLCATFFGLLFGSVFAYDGIVPALWLHPLSHPITVLFVSVAAGGALLTVGLLLDALNAYFRGKLAYWMLTDMGVLISYAGVWLAFLDQFGLLLIGLGIFWNVLGNGFARPAAPLRAALKATGELLERTLQLAVNTISFARVGAFALAHAGLSAAIVGLASQAHGLAALVIMVVGNAFALVLEGLVVSIQTTRLMLFEFFVRFVRAQGRAFRPLAPPGRPSHQGV